MDELQSTVLGWRLPRSLICAINYRVVSRVGGLAIPDIVPHPLRGGQLLRMIMSAETLSDYDKAKELASHLEENFIELGKLLDRLNTYEPDEFRKLLHATGLGSRKAYYLIEIERTFRKIPVGKKRLLKLGWSKLMILAKHINKTNYADMLRLAEENTARELQLILRGEPPESKQHCLLFYLNTGDFERLAEAMSMFGGKRVHRSIVDKEEALMRMVDHVLGEGSQ